MAIEKNQGKQTNQVKKFQNLSVDYTKIIDKMSINDRMAMLRSSNGRDLLSSLSPYQLAEMFPDYYKRQYPDVGALLKSISSPMFKKLSREQADASMEIDRKRLAAGERISYPKPEIIPKWLKKLQEETGATFSDPGAKAQLSAEKQTLLEELSKGAISADDPRVEFLKELSGDDLIKAGISKETDANGNTIFQRAPTSASTLTDEQIADKLKSEAQTSFSPRERATLDLISKREGSSHQDIVFGDKGGVPGSGVYSKALGLDKRPLSDRSIAEVLDLQKQLTQITRKDGHGGGKGTSAVGTGQMVRETLIGNLRALNIPESEWPNIKFDKNLQERLTLQNFKSSGIGDPNADPSTWNMRALGKQYESLDVSKGFKGITSAEMQNIAEASPTKSLPGPVTAESVTAKRQQLEQEERQKQQTFLAEKTIPKLPDGVDPGIAKDFEKFSPRQKQDTLAMFEKAGKGDIAKGVETVNQLYKQNPTLVQEAVFQGNGKLLFSDASVAARAAQLNPYMQNSLNKFQEFAPEGTTITSTFRGTDHPIEAAKIRRGRAAGAHSRGAAVDIRTEGKSKEELVKTVQSLKRAGFTKVLLEGDHIHAEVNPGQNFHISNLGKGNPNIDLKTANEGASVVAFNEELTGSQKDRDNPKPPQTASIEPTPAPTVGTEVTTTQATPQAQIPQESTPQTQTQTQQTAQAQPSEAETQPVPVLAEGGAKSLDTTEIRAMPIKDLKGDNSVVIDKNDNPIFTMNTDKEQAKYDPVTKQVDIQPVEKPTKNDNLLTAEVINNSNKQVSNVNVFAEGGTQSLDAGNITPTMKTDPDKLVENQQSTQTMSETENLTSKQNQIQPVVLPETSSTNRSTDTSVNITEELFKDPSFKRAIAKTRFVDTGDASLGGHFGMANADLG